MSCKFKLYDLEINLIFNYLSKRMSISPDWVGREGLQVELTEVKRSKDNRNEKNFKAKLCFFLIQKN